MAQKSRPDPSNGTVVSADEYEGISLGAFEDAVIGTTADSPVVYADATGRQVKVRAGKLAVVRGYAWYSDPTTDEIINNGGAGLPANTSGNPRIDRLVLRLDRVARTVRTVYVQGTPQPFPVPVALNQNTSLSAGVWDFPLARWTAINGYTTVAAADLTYESWYRGPGGAILCTSTSRPFAAYAYPGAEVYEVDTATNRQWDGTAWQVKSFTPPFLYARRTSAANSFVNDTNLRDDDVLILNVLPNAVYDITSEIVYSSSTAADFKVGWSGPAGATLTWNVGGMASTAADPSGPFYSGLNNSITGTDTLGGAGGITLVVARPTGILVTGPTGGQFKFRYAQGTLDAVNGTQLHAGSKLIATRRT